MPPEVILKFVGTVHKSYSDNMKVAIVLCFLAAVVFAQDGKVVFPKNCPDFKLVYPELKEKIDLLQTLGPWMAIRAGPVHDTSKYENKDCLRSLYYQDDTTETNQIKYLKHCRNDGTHKIISGSDTLKGVDGGKADNYFETTFKHPEEKDVTVNAEAVMLDTDDGETWSLWAACINDGKNKTVHWSIMSRYPWIDARLEQKLVERIEKYGGVGPTQLRGIGQTDCYKQKKA